jgi:hypothetical protein
VPLGEQAADRTFCETETFSDSFHSVSEHLAADQDDSEAGEKNDQVRMPAASDFGG